VSRGAAPGTLFISGLRRFSLVQLFQPAAALALLAGALAVQVLPALPPRWFDFAFAAFALAFLPWRARWLGFLLFGAA